jgi:hypothetical protein
MYAEDEITNHYITCCPEDLNVTSDYDIWCVADRLECWCVADRLECWATITCSVEFGVAFIIACCVKQT